MKYAIKGRVVLDVEAIADLDHRPTESHAENILKGGYYDTRTKGISVEVTSIDRRDP